MPAIRALRKARPGLGIVAHGARPERHAASEAIDAGRHRLRRQELAGRRARAGRRRGRRGGDASSTRRRAATAAGRELTRRQRQILQLYADGHSTERAAQRLGLSTETVRTHTKAVLARLEARDRAHAVAIGLRRT